MRSLRSSPIAGCARAQPYAHRGLHGGACIENSTGAFAAAIAAGLGIECDVQLTADYRAIVFHDWELDRLTAASGPVAARTAAELGQVALRGSGETLPALARLAGAGCRARPAADRTQDHARRPFRRCAAPWRATSNVIAVDAGDELRPAGRAVVCRQCPAHGARAGGQRRERAHHSAAAIRRHVALRRARPDFLAYDVRDLPSRFAAAQGARRLPVLTWTVRTRAAERAGARRGWIAEGEGLAPAGKSA